MKTLTLFGGKLALAAALLLGMSSTASAGLIIDTFDVNQGPVTGSTVGTFSSTVFDNGGSILGDEREIILSVLVDNSSTFDAAVAVADGFLSIQNPTNVNSTTEILWNGVGNGGLGGIDLTAGGLNIGILVKVLASNLGTPTADNVIMLALADLGGDTQTLSVNVPDGPGDYLFSFASFNAPGLDLTQVNSISLKVSGNQAFDMDIDFVESSQVPEPSTMLLSGVALLALGLLRKRIGAKA